MSYCTNCGVELEKDLRSCPLCGFTPGTSVKTETDTSSELYPSDIILLYKKETRRNIWELSGIISFSGIAVCTIVDFIVHKSLSWSLFADTSILGSWICLTLILLAFRKYFVIFPGLLLTILSMQLLFDLFIPPLGWFYALGLPITVAFFICAGIVILLWKAAHLKGFDILAIAFLVFAGFCILCEVFIDKYAFGKVDIRWSAVVAISVLPLALVLLFVHYRMKKGKRLDSYFHV
jgi:hypothetical protein